MGTDLVKSPICSPQCLNLCIDQKDCESAKTTDAHLEQSLITCSRFLVFAVTTALAVSAEEVAVQSDMTALLGLLWIIAWPANHDIADKAFLFAICIVRWNWMSLRCPDGAMSTYSC